MNRHGDRVVDDLAGMGGAPGVPGRVYVVGLPADPMSLSARAATLLASADVVVTHEDPSDPALKVARDARVEHRRVGSLPRLPDGVVVRVTRHLPVHRTPGLVDELAGLDRAGIEFELCPVPVDEPGLPTLVTAWRNRRPLTGLRVLVPRTREQASSLSAHVRSLGGVPVEAPTIAVEEGERHRLVDAVHELVDGRFAAVCFTSPNGVDAFAEVLDAEGFDSRDLARTRAVACVGPGTAARLHERLHVVADRVPEVATTEGLAEAFPEGQGRVLLPRADIATNMLADGLLQKGWTPVEVAAYRTVQPDDFPDVVVRMLGRGEVDLLAFASSSTVRNFVRIIGDRPWSGDVVSIGPVTSATAAELGVPVSVEADPHTLDGLVDALVVAARRRRG